MLYSKRIVFLLLVFTVMLSIQLWSSLVEADQSPRNARKQLRKIFDWSQYKAVFKKVYTSHRDEHVRKSLFIGNVLKVFAHNLRYKMGKTTYFLSVNQLSDRAQKELDSMYNHQAPEMDVPKNDAKRTLTEVNDELVGDVQLEGISIEEYQKELARIIEEQQSDEIPMKQQHNVNYSPIKLVDEAEDDLTSVPMPAKDHSDSLDRTSTVNSVKKKLSSLPKLFSNGRSGNLKASKTSNAQVCSASQKGSSQQNEYYIDWRNSGCLTEPREQKTCGSCYAFATVALMEWTHCRNIGRLVSFSEQYMIDCGGFLGLGACNGGYLTTSVAFVMDWGVELLSNYPYQEKQNTCPYNKDDWEKAGHKKPVMISFKKVTDRNLWPKILRDIGPMLIVIGVPSDVSLFGGGIHTGHNCLENNGQHAMLLVGHGLEDGQEYWILRNSFGQHWGESGYIRLSKNAHEHCFITANESWFHFSDSSSFPSLPSSTIEENLERGGGQKESRKLSPAEINSNYLMSNF